MMKQITLNKMLSVTLLLAIVGALGMIGYTIATPKAGDRLTEFYILGLGGKATDYPTELTIGEEGKVIVCIVNREHKAVTYRMEVVIDGVESSKTESITLKHGEEWERIIGFIPIDVGDGQKVEFLLYRRGTDKAYLDTHLWVDVRKL